VSEKIHAERIGICEACKWFKKSTKSCGTLIAAAFQRPVEDVEAIMIKENRVKHYKKPVQLCGCRMDVKTKFAWASCPAEKWLPVRINKDELIELKALAKYLKGRGSFNSNEEVFQKFLIFMRKLTGENVQFKGCNSCMRDLITLAEQSVQDIED
jgi:hypothetical protein